ncbi:hypothetical protein SAMN06265222_1611 [Neorhodopirellula lusitana]|uniref:Uncharacterized protein n=1 Tax=Neorhodopirellula lusitana TaxID=445327 RepID=A0ABY1QUR9_9BACT|nr:hypothetical protein SAMN06265222_1611 [Neorhodopirellula lusitana]
MLVTPTLEVRTRSPTPVIACARVVDRHRSEDYARGRSGSQFKSTHSLQVHCADNDCMHRSRCASAPVVAFGIIPPPLRHPCPVMLGVIRLKCCDRTRKSIRSTAPRIARLYATRCNAHSTSSRDAHAEGRQPLRAVSTGLADHRRVLDRLVHSRLLGVVHRNQRSCVIQAFSMDRRDVLRLSDCICCFRDHTRSFRHLELDSRPFFTSTVAAVYFVILGYLRDLVRFPLLLLSPANPGRVNSPSWITKACTGAGVSPLRWLPSALYHLHSATPAR